MCVFLPSTNTETLYSHKQGLANVLQQERTQLVISFVVIIYYINQGVTCVPDCIQGRPEPIYASNFTHYSSKNSPNYSPIIPKIIPIFLILF